MMVHCAKYVSGAKFKSVASSPHASLQACNQESAQAATFANEQLSKLFTVLMNGVDPCGSLPKYTIPNVLFQNDI